MGRQAATGAGETSGRESGNGERCGLAIGYGGLVLPLYPSEDGLDVLG
jgi:hypothetical protein